MTLQEMRDSTKEFLTPEEVAGCIGCMPYSITSQAKEDATRLGFAVTVIGTRVRIPRRAFLHWVRFGNAPVFAESVREVADDDPEVDTD